ncbi:MAG: hypothetical protein EXR98_06905 [Gemmataceae bacterium]|nr:hypothetical protein [Gemmataceae bacterium]
MEIIVRPASSRFQWRAVRVLHWLDTPFFRHHHWIAHVYAEWAMSPSVAIRLLAWSFARIVGRQKHPSLVLTTTATREHDREENLQAGADKFGRLLFSTHIPQHRCGAGI